MASIHLRLQRCGKKNCKCYTKKKLHGPYFWLVSYKRDHGLNGKLKQKWKYLGKTHQELLDFANGKGSRFNITEDLINKKEELLQKRIQNKDQIGKSATITIAKGKIEAN